MGEWIHLSIFRRTQTENVIWRLLRDLSAEAATAKAIAINPQSKMAAA